MKFLENFGINSIWLILIIGFGLIYWIFQIFDFGSYRVIAYMVATAPVWLPVATFVLFYEYWLYYVRKDFDLKQGRVTLEIRLPQDVFKSPEAMELVLSQLYQPAGPDNHVQTYWDGKKPPTFSLEIASRGGDVHFYINTPRKKFKNLIEAQLYAQYPGVEIHELDIDYTAEVPWDPTKFSVFAFHFGLKEKDAYPIKTYIEYGLDKLPKEEEKTDPITSILEALGSIGTGEFMWIQILITANRKENFKTGSLTSRADWRGAAQKEIDTMLEVAQKRIGAESKSMMHLTDTEKLTINAIQRSLGKNAFNTVIRGLYVATLSTFSPADRLGALASCWRTFDDINRNSISVRWRTDFDWNWWQDPKDRRKNALKKAELNEYKRRAYTSYNKADTPKVLTTEELATIFHLPGKVAMTPSLARIPSKRAEAPPNLPIGH